MTYTTPITWVDGQIVLASDVNAQVRDNMIYVHDLAIPQFAKVTAHADYTTTSVSFVDVDATNLNVGITTTSGKVLVFVSGSAYNSGVNSVYFDVILDSATRAGGVNGSAELKIGALNPNQFAFAVPFTGLSNAAHTFKLQWMTTAGTATLVGNGLISIVVLGVN